MSASIQPSFCRIQVNFPLLFNLLHDHLRCWALPVLLASSSSTCFLLPACCCHLPHNLHLLHPGLIHTAVHGTAQFGAHSCPCGAGKHNLSLIKVETTILLSTLFVRFSRRSCDNEKKS